MNVRIERFKQMKKIAIRFGFIVALTATAAGGFVSVVNAAPNAPQATRQYCC